METERDQFYQGWGNKLYREGVYENMTVHWYQGKILENEEI